MKGGLRGTLAGPLPTTHLHAYTRPPPPCPPPTSQHGVGEAGVHKVLVWQLGNLGRGARGHGGGGGLCFKRCFAQRPAGARSPHRIPSSPRCTPPNQSTTMYNPHPPRALIVPDVRPALLQALPHRRQRLVHHPGAGVGGAPQLSARGPGGEACLVEEPGQRTEAGAGRTRARNGQSRGRQLGWASDVGASPTPPLTWQLATHSRCRRTQRWQTVTRGGLHPARREARGH